VSTAAPATSSSTLAPSIAEAAYGVPIRRTAVVLRGPAGSLHLAGHYASPQTAHHQARRREAGYDGASAYLVRHHSNGTTSVYLDPDTVLATLPTTRPLSACDTAGSGGVSCPCGAHRDRCRFGADHHWSVWYRDAVLVRTAATYHCHRCGGVCTAEEAA